MFQKTPFCKIQNVWRSRTRSQIRSAQRFGLGKFIHLNLHKQRKNLINRIPRASSLLNFTFTSNSISWLIYSMSKIIHNQLQMKRVNGQLNTYYIIYLLEQLICKFDSEKKQLKDIAKLYEVGNILLSPFDKRKCQMFVTVFEFYMSCRSALSLKLK